MMPWPNLYALSIVTLVLLGFYLMDVLNGRFRHSHDALAANMARVSTSAPCWFLIWFSLSALLGIVFPLMAQDDLNWFNERNGLLITLDYTLFVPALVGAYISLCRKSEEFFSPATLEENGLAWREDYASSFLSKKEFWNCASKTILLLLAAPITYAAVLSITDTEIDLASPWAIDAKWLTFSGSYYYALRGINAYMALGLIFLGIAIFVKFMNGLELRKPELLLNEHLSVKQSIQEYSYILVIASFLGTMVTVLHGTALLEEIRLSNNEISLQLLLDSTWIAWAILAVIATFSLIYGVIWLHLAMRRSYEHVRQQMIRDVEKLYGEQPASLETYAAKLDAMSKVKTYVETHHTSPLSKSGYVMVSASVLVQAFNIWNGLVDVWSRSPPSG